MNNLIQTTEFLRLLSTMPLGYSAPYVVPPDKSYDTVSKGLIATAHRIKVKISTSKILIVDPSTLATVEAVKVTLK